MWSQDSRLLCLVLVSYLSRFDADITKISWSYFVSRITLSYDSSHYLVSLTPYPRIASLCLVLHFLSRSSILSVISFYLVLLSHFYLFVVPRVCVSYQYAGSYRVIDSFVLGISFIRSLSFVHLILLSRVSSLQRVIELSSRSRCSFDRLITSTD